MNKELSGETATRHIAGYPIEHGLDREAAGQAEPRPDRLHAEYCLRLLPSHRHADRVSGIDQVLAVIFGDRDQHAFHLAVVGVVAGLVVGRDGRAAILADIAAISDGRNPVAHDGVGGTTPSQMVAHANDLAEKAMILAETILNALNAVEITRE